MSDRLLKESDVLKAIDKRIEALSKDPEFVRKNGIIDVMGIKKYILAIPSVDRPKGEWISIIEVNDFGEPYQAGIYCSECGETFGHETNFCPYCGADMRESRERRE